MPRQAVSQEPGDGPNEEKPHHQDAQGFQHLGHGHGAVLDDPELGVPEGVPFGAEELGNLVGERFFLLIPGGVLFEATLFSQQGGEKGFTFPGGVPGFLEQGRHFLFHGVP